MPARSRDGVVYHGQQPWNRDRPRNLVIACSDGRLQKEIDGFLLNHLQIVQYDRLYLPGGPGALAYSGGETSRASHYRRDCLHLIRTHRIRRAVLLFHGPADGGPEEAICADYQRKLPGISAQQVRAQQEADVIELVRWRAEWAGQAQLHAFRGEVTADGTVQFVALTAAPRPEDDTGSLR
jgi:hypothetical protein